MISYDTVCHSHDCDMNFMKIHRYSKLHTVTTHDKTRLDDKTITT